MAIHEKFGNETTRKITETWTTSDNYRYNYEKMSAAHELAAAEVGSLVASLLAAHEKEVA